jgi:hypothetical protein
MSEPRFVKCVFRDGDTRSYPYRHDGEEPIEVGMRVEAPSPKGGFRTVLIVEILDAEPELPAGVVMRAIRIIPPAPEAEAVA